MEKFKKVLFDKLKVGDKFFYGSKTFKKIDKWLGEEIKKPNFVDAFDGKKVFLIKE